MKEKIQSEAAATDVGEFITDLDGGHFDHMLSIALSKVAAAVIDHEKKGKVTVDLEFERIDGTKEAFEKDHPGAGDLFAAEHGGDGAPGEDHEEEAAQLDGEGPDDETPDSEGGEPDAAPVVTRSTRTARGREKTREALAKGVH